MLKNVPIRVKLFIAPVIISLLMVGIWLGARHGFVQQGAALDTVVNENFASANDSARLLQTVSETQSDIFRLMVWGRLQRDAEELDAIRGSIDQRIEAVTTLAGTIWPEFAELSEDEDDSGDVEADNAIVEELHNYIQAATRGADMARLNPTLASAVVVSAATSYDNLSQMLEAEYDATVEGARQQRDRSAETIDEISGYLTAAVAGAVFLAALLTLLMGGHIAGAIRRSVVVTSRLAEGDTAVDVTDTDRRDEIGLINRSLQVFKENALKVQNLTDEEIQRAREREAKAAEEKRRSEVLALANELESNVKTVVDGLSKASSEMSAETETMTRRVADATTQADAASTGSRDASNKITAMAAAIEELSSSIDEVGSRASESMDIANRAVEEAKSTDATVASLSEAAQRIDEVIALIDDISKQTNLLALNATIEAARAGEAGKGFSVVASEVKSLANQTGKATTEIATQIATMQSVTNNAVNDIRSIAKTITSISEVASAIASAVAQQTSVTREISGNVQQASDTADQVAENVSSVSGAMGETGKAATNVLHQAEGLAERAQDLDAQVGEFLNRLRAD
ncbi:methyl-accepting chemotaxis protein [Fodinicurvata sp. EGI_FJ10296]|uniref:methyl-accepting chemotaxis protein n=1 Tax=Fodinicurvata sp. EGI_FJ10296 TaxID=3231908 RepID=UPI003452B031